MPRAGALARHKSSLRDYLLSRKGSGQHFAENEEIYNACPDGGKLRATAVAEVGAR